MLLPVRGFAEPVDFKIYAFNGVGDADNDQVRDGIQLFVRLVREQCKIKIEPQISVERRGEPGDWEYDGDWRDLAVNSGQVFSFHNYQAGMYRLATREQLPQVPRQIAMFVRSGWENCATSFPIVEFYDAHEKSRTQNRELNRTIVPWIANRIMLVSQSSQRACESYPRMVAHEIGHIFIQDDPPHYCPAPGSPDRMIPCYGENLMAHTMQLGRDPMDEGFATGTMIYEPQCRQIEKSLGTLWDPLP